jgi:hypothetical protein
VFNAIFNNISVISWRSALLVEETGENHLPDQNVVCNVQPAYKGQSGYLRIYSLLCPTVCKVIFKVELGFCGI